MPASPKTNPADTSLFNLNPCRFHFVAQFRSLEETRYYLNGVHIEPHPNGGVVMVATDGHRMGIAHDPEGSCSGHVIISPESAGSIFKPRPTLRDKMRVELSVVGDLGKDRLLATRRNLKGETDQTSIVSLIDGKFPNWRGVIPWELFDAKDQFFGAFDASLLKTFGAEFNGKTAPLGMRQKSEGDPILIHREDIPWFLGVLMPRRNSHGISDELRALAPRPKAA